MSRILLLISHKENRRLLRDGLAMRYEVVTPHTIEGVLQPFDLCMLDGPALHRLGEGIRALKKLEHPAFLPFLLVTHSHETGMATQHLWQTIDELIVSPVKKVELLARVENLLEMRRLSLENVTFTRRLEAELVRAGTVQAELLPREIPDVSGFELAARCVPAREVGGDFYDWQELAPGVLMLTLGDVMGKGMPAALLMATTRATLRALSRRNPPAEALRLAQQSLETDLERTSSFVTAFHARLNAGLKRLVYVDAGHSHAFLRRADGALEVLKRNGLPLGALSQYVYREGVVTFQPGDTLVVYSDGLLDACKDIELEHLTIAEQLRGVSPASQIVERLIDWATSKDSPRDDLTVIALRCTDGRQAR